MAIKRFLLGGLCCFILALLSCGAVHAAQQPANAEWPRVFTKGDREVVLYQPQLDTWVDYRNVTFRMAVGITPGKDQEMSYGVIAVSAPTKVDHSTRLVLIDKPTVEYRFPNASAEQAVTLEKIVKEIVPNRKEITVSLDRMLAYVDAGVGGQREVVVNLDPPPIFYSSKPAVLVVFIGKPEFEPIKGTSLMAAVNTNWDIFFDGKSAYYMRLDESWLQTADPVKGPWKAASAAPAEIGKLPYDDNWKDVRHAYPGKALSNVPAVIVSTQPAELIVTDGEPKYSPISGTKLMQISNTEGPVFYFPEESNNYYLVAGRWFRAPKLDGPWTAATLDLPGDFANIPADHELAYVRASVPKTEEAMDAILLASVPRTAKVKKNGTTVDVTYEGAPKFEPIPQTQVSFAVNSPNQVFLVGSRYYCCYQGIWFDASSVNGPWVVCTSVPQEIYAIPADHPTHNVTYVYVYDDDDDEVEVHYTSGYTGEYVAGGLLLFGAGMIIGAEIADDDDWWYYAHFHYSTNWFSYGCGAIYNPIYGGYYRAAHWYGPYGGAGRAGYYNPATGGWARGGYRYGPAGGAWAAAGYNPYTNTFKARAGGSSIYGSWSRGYVQSGDSWVRGGTREGVRGSAGWVQGSGGGAAAAWDTRRGEGAVVKGPGDNVFVGHDGNVYRRDPDGDWQQSAAGGWKDAGGVRTAGTAATTGVTQQRATPVRQTPTRTQVPTTRNQDVVSKQPGTRDLGAGLNNDAVARDLGNRTATRSQASATQARSRVGDASAGRSIGSGRSGASQSSFDRGGARSGGGRSGGGRSGGGHSGGGRSGGGRGR